MGRRLPPLHFVRAFEAAASRLSFTNAARELHITQSAVSQQIRELERSLGVKLFERSPRRLSLTEDGRILYEGAQSALALLRSAVDRLGGRRNANRLVVSVLPSFGTKWLVPRLHRWLRRNADLRLSILPSVELVDFARDEVDVALRWGTGNWPNLHVEKVLGEQLFPVCSPGFLKRNGPFSQAADLLNAPLLCDTTHEMWDEWFASSEVFAAPLQPVAYYDDASNLIQAAIDGQGVALARSALVADDLAAGRVVRLFDGNLPSPRAYYFVCTPRTAADASLLAFRAWLMEEAEETGRQIAGVPPLRQGRTPPKSARPRRGSPGSRRRRGKASARNR
jgi:LysR family glycine cleavage system transcriptional activator